MHMEKDTVLYSQLQPWNTISANPYKDEEAGPPDPEKVGPYYQINRPRPLRPRFGVEEKILPTLRTKNIWEDPTSPSEGAPKEQEKSRSHLTGIVRNPGHQPRAALYSRYTPFEWSQKMTNFFHDLETNKNYSEKLKADMERLIRETDKTVAEGQEESHKRLSERINDLILLRNKVKRELERLTAESERMQDQSKFVQKTIDDIDDRLHIAEECLYQREKRTGIDLVHDDVEQALVKELQTYRSNQDRLKTLFSKIQNQKRNLRGAQHELEYDVNSKESALGIDKLCYNFNNSTKGITYYGGIERYDPTITNTETWAKNSLLMVAKSKEERVKSAFLRSEIENLISMSLSEVLGAWNNTNIAMARRADETLGFKNKLEKQLERAQGELINIQKYIEQLEKAITEKSVPIKVAHTRLEVRSHRTFIESCRDKAQDRLVTEVKNLQDTIEVLRNKLHEAEAQQQRLLETRTNIQYDLKTKINTLLIDRTMCMGIREQFANRVIF